MDHLRSVHVENVEEINSLCCCHEWEDWVVYYGKIVMLKSFFDILFINGNVFRFLKRLCDLKAQRINCGWVNKDWILCALTVSVLNNGI